MLKRMLLLAALVLTAISATTPNQVRELPEPPCWPCLG